MSSTLDPGMAAARLEEAVRQLRTGQYDPQEVYQIVASISGWLFEQFLPPCTCGEWQGPPWSQHWYCRRHHLGGGSISTPPSVTLLAME